MNLQNAYFSFLGGDGRTPWVRACLEKAGCQVVEISNPKLTHMILPLPAFAANGSITGGEPLAELVADDITGRVKTYEAIVKGNNVPKPGVPESFKVLVKELQSLCLDIRVLDESGNEIELKDEDEDDEVIYSTEDETYVTDEQEVFESGYNVDEDGPEDIMDVFSDLAEPEDGQLDGDE